MIKLIDLSQAIAEDVLPYPGTPPNKIRTIAHLAKDGFRETQILISSHTATHLDTPAHIIAEGKRLDDFPVSNFIGKGRVLDCSHQFPNTEEVIKILSKQKIDFLLCYTGWAGKWGSPAYFENYPVMSNELAGVLDKFNLKGLGIDCPSFDTIKSQNLPIHQILLKGGLVLLENLCNLHHLLSLNFTFICLPLKIAGGEAAPVRAVALLE